MRPSTPNFSRSGLLRLRLYWAETAKLCVLVRFYCSTTCPKKTNIEFWNFYQWIVDVVWKQARPTTCTTKSTRETFNVLVEIVFCSSTAPLQFGCDSYNKYSQAHMWNTSFVVFESLSRKKRKL